MSSLQLFAIEIRELRKRAVARILMTGRPVWPIDRIDPMSAGGSRLSLIDGERQVRRAAPGLSGLHEGGVTYARNGIVARDAKGSGVFRECPSYLGLLG